ncbi:bifunctional diaminohydroxyphosphoribosylaminopyrimidine deaminase/5-amino-6-(5-phosphoribosylamino)uracil reductase RibD [Myxococcota bacterium]|nr:bifunctional diaminohydroxyphosphoribosylaminopyrimidine deaminase/5-amino-6-(5-phosphoribosylamino)uracil reductase RibD [Myxococcota bacterium]MBU1429615.1 bifunctional diaminohydroxyphosphoribosylaminopyrimidine deaminase/5-amino-6-(5-phosphoribosylamino)uracil reductase RibD [Myxococcota bacterium]MBU1897421.1 bifunctional diaminohydroxyphosphoribosylaminopyrimidine deaminase/5-amino-6-(5-phosphoribosylamino)uracil reductase RibD [Myxococcota bacterium]
MQRALALAQRPPRRVSPNPAVGCVIVRDGSVIAEGVTQPPGGPHAEIMALRMAGRRAQGADLYVTLEPCCHTGRTPPCAEAIIAAGVRRVFIGALDPNPLVDGGGVEMLRAAGIEVSAICEAAAARQIAPFQRFLDGRPWVTLKAAVTLDGRIATTRGDSKWITGEVARADAHRLRAGADAVLVGAETARLDDPRLNVRMVEGDDPLRVVLDARLSLSVEAQILGAQAIILHGPVVDPAHARALAATGARLWSLPVDEAGRIDLHAALRRLAAELGVIHLLVEGGGQLHGALLSAGLADELIFYIAPKLIGEGRPVLALPSVDEIAQGWRLRDLEITPMGEDVRVRGLIERSADVHGLD